MLTGRWIGPGPRANRFQGGFQNGTCRHTCPCGGTHSSQGLLQCLGPQGELQLPPASSKGSSRSAGRSDPGSFQMTASALVTRACEILCCWVTQSCLTLWDSILTWKSNLHLLHEQAHSLPLSHQGSPVRFCVRPLTVRSFFLQLSGSPDWPSDLNFLVIIFLVQDPQTG